jgi:DNA-binding CsgD family transcriptional regulator
VREFSEAKYLKWRRRMAIVMARLGRESESEDCLNAFCVSMLEGKSKHQTLDQFAIDYLRTSSGVKGSSGYDQRQRLLTPNPIDETISRSEYGFDPRRDVDTRIDLERCRGLVKGARNRFVFQAYHFEGATMREIGEELAITESRAGQILSNAEKGVAKLLATGLSNKEIADKLFVTDKTVKFHLTNIYQKTNVQSRGAFIANYAEEFRENQTESKQEESEMSNWEPMNKPQALPSAQLAPLQANQNQLRAQQQATSQENVTFVVNTFKVNETIQDLQTMSKEVTKGDYSVDKVMAACQCIGRMNETIQTVMKASQIISGR